MFLFYMLIVMLMFPAAGVLLVVTVHEGLSQFSARQKQPRAQGRVAKAIQRATQEITAIMGLGDD